MTGVLVASLLLSTESAAVVVIVVVVVDVATVLLLSSPLTLLSVSWLSLLSLLLLATPPMLSVWSPRAGAIPDKVQDYWLEVKSPKIHRAVAGVADALVRWR